PSSSSPTSSPRSATSSPRPSSSRPATSPTTARPRGSPTGTRTGTTTPSTTRTRGRSAPTLSAAQVSPVLDLLALDFMRDALLAALLVGVAAPLVGFFLVQRRMSLIGDGIGHVALAGVGVGIFTGSSPVWTALVAAVVAAVVIELVQRLGRTSG